MSSRRNIKQHLNRLLQRCLLAVLILMLAGCGAPSTAVIFRPPDNNSSDQSSQGGTSNSQDPVPESTTPPIVVQNPWEDACSKVDDILSSSDIVDNLQVYGTTASQISNYIAIVEEAQPALDLIDQLRSYEVNLLLVRYNAYDLLIDGLNATQPGTGTAIKDLESSIRTLIEVKQALDALESVSHIINAISNFRGNCSENGLVGIAESISSYLPDIANAGCELEKAKTDIDNITNQISTIKSGLRGVQNLLNTPYVSDAIKAITSALDDISGIISPFKEIINSFQGQINSNLSALNNVRDSILEEQGVDPGNNRISVNPCTGIASWNQPVNNNPVLPPSNNNPGTPSITPEETVRQYWAAVSNGNYEKAWSLLSEAWRIRNHDNNFQSYANGYKERNYCSISTSNIRLQGKDSLNATVTTHLTYRSGKKCTASEYDFIISLVLDTVRNIWLYDRGKEQ